MQTPITATSELLLSHESIPMNPQTVYHQPLMNKLASHTHTQKKKHGQPRY